MARLRKRNAESFPTFCGGKLGWCRSSKYFLEDRSHRPGLIADQHRDQRALQARHRNAESHKALAPRRRRRTSPFVPPIEFLELAASPQAFNVSIKPVRGVIGPGERNIVRRQGRP
jgi:hypothetical protein